MKKISIVIPCYNEIQNVRLLTQKITTHLSEKLPEYNYELLFIDNNSSDGTQDEIIKLCMENPKIKAIFNARNFGTIRSPFYGIINSDGDCTIQMAADFQDPPEMIVDFIKKWEEGFKIVIGVKTTSEESKIMYFLRSLYYRLIKKISDIDHIDHFTGFGLYDKSFVDVLKRLNDPYPYLRGIVGELGFRRYEIAFKQPRRKNGVTKNNWYTLYDFGMLGITSYTKIILRLATIMGFGIAAFSFLISIFYFVLKLLFWNRFPMGIAPIIISIFFLGSVQLFFIGLIGEYILNINTRIMNRPLVVEDKRINF